MNNLILNLGNKHFESIVRIDTYKNQDLDIIPTFLNNDIDISDMLNFSVSDSEHEISKELYKKELFESIVKYLTFVIENIYPDINKDSIFKIIQMYLLNRILSRKPEDDSVISYTNSKYADEQLEKDLIYQLKLQNKIALPKEIKFIKDEFNNMFKNKASLLNNFSYISDGDFSIEGNNFVYDYTLKNYEDDTLETLQIKIPIYKHVIPVIDSLSKKMIRMYICSYIRYSYLNLTTLALAFDYQNNSLTRDLDKNNTLEAFASLYNKYYTNWCSAFPDVESIFGSKGSFFNLKNEEILKYENVVVNPPFDENFIKNSLLKIEECLKMKKEDIKSNTRFIIIVCHWEDIPSIMTFKQKYKYKVYKKGELDFIDYFSVNKKMIKPCDIIVFDII